MKTVKFFTLGCKVNQYDTQIIREQFLNYGFQEIKDSLAADMYIINTCTVTHRADSGSLNYIRKAQRENPQAKIIVTGCLAELDGDKINKIDGINLIIKNKDKENIFKHLFCSNEYNTQTSSMHRGISYFEGHTRAFLKIQDGCDNTCSYCKVPKVRGISRSKPLDEIIQEAGQLIKNGYKEIVLTGICLGLYGKDLYPKISLLNVIDALEKIDGLLRIRLSSIEAGDVSDALINKMSESGKLCKHLHMPIQSGDDEILKKMNRKVRRQDYLNLIENIKCQIPGIAITTDVLVGFPGEGEINFKNTIDLIKKISPLKVHIFPYSPRQGTAAYNFRDKLNPTIIKQRILRLKEITWDCSSDYKKRFLNKDMDVLIENQSKAKEAPDLWQGYTGNYIKVMVRSGQNLRNQLILLRLKKIAKDYLLGDFC